jgi:hypothetical protein
MEALGILFILFLTTAGLITLLFTTEKFEERWDREDDPKNWDWHKR